MNKQESEELLQAKDRINSIPYQDEELQYVNTFYGENDKYELYLFPKKTEVHLNWHDAKEYCKHINGDLPTIGELNYIDLIKLNANLNNYHYWSSTDSSDLSAYYYNFSNGNIEPVFKVFGLCVRAIKRVRIQNKKEE